MIPSQLLFRGDLVSTRNGEHFNMGVIDGMILLGSIGSCHSMSVGFNPNLAVKHAIAATLLG